jgi:hypothetical protein
MKITPDCIVCNLNAGLTAIREVTSEKESIKELSVEIMKLPAMRGLDWSITGSHNWSNSSSRRSPPPRATRTHSDGGKSSITKSASHFTHLRDKP